jgi:hypothetical protein
MGFVVYLCPILLLLYSQRDVLNNELYSNLRHSEQTPTLDALLEAFKSLGRRVKNIDIAPLVDNRYIDVHDYAYPNSLLYAKTVVKGLLLIIALPVAVSVFGFFLFSVSIEEQILVEWTKPFDVSRPVTVLSYSIGGSVILRVKAALFLGILSAASALGSLISSTDRFTEFLEDTFAKEIILDKQLLGLFRILEQGEHKYEESVRGKQV